MSRHQFSDEYDTALRAAAMRHLAVLSNDGTLPVPWAEINDFEFRGKRMQLTGQQGIRKPEALDSALCITTTYTAPGKRPPYEDQMDPGSPLLRYKWRGDDPHHFEVGGLRRAGELGKPLVWFYATAPAVYLPIFPVYVVGEEPEEHQFVISLEPAIIVDDGKSGVENLAAAALRRYAVAETKIRVHQPLFRANVLRAYRGQCAVCSIGHNELLDAAHIIPDSHPDGVPETYNALSLCKIHHAAFDSNILGVNPDYRVEIREDILREVDGPMLEYGLKRLHGGKLMVVPRNRLEKPNRELLTRAYERFLAAG